MTETMCGQVWTGPLAVDDEAFLLRNAETVYHDCLARFGHNSAEAYVAQVYWRRLRAQHRSESR